MSKRARIDARLIYSASESDANMLWATRFFAPDPFIFILKRGKRYLVMNDLELDFLSLLEEREARLLSWGYVDGAFERSELGRLAFPICPG